LTWVADGVPVVDGCPPVTSPGMETIEVERDGAGIVTITLNRPEKKNAINTVMWDELLVTFREIEGADADRVVVITGAGGAFCSGADLSGADPEAEPRHQWHQMRHVGSVALALQRLPQPVIAKVGGVAAGAGCNLALGCDLIVASDEARFSEIFARRGLSIDFGGSWVLPRLIGLHRAKELALFADIISAKEAEAMGLVNRVVPAGDLDAFVASWASRLAAGPPIALAQTKRLLNNSFEVSLEQALEDEGWAQSVNFGTADTAEAMQAFLQKREPKFRGR
jgi:enoyl-CoA hydratase/carnithine racemase